MRLPQPEPEPTVETGSAPAAPTRAQQPPAARGPLVPTLLRNAPNSTGLPDDVKAGVERISGLSLEDVRVHRGSSRPQHLGALAYTQGTEIHLRPGQERFAAHEAWHVVQQLQGRVRPTLQLHGTAINTDQALEHEADVMGRKALQPSGGAEFRPPRRVVLGTGPVVQRQHEELVTADKIVPTKGTARTSYSLGGVSKKPLAVIEGTLKIAEVVRDVEVHVHLNANNPITTFSGANVRLRGAAVGFAYWPAALLTEKPWLTRLLATINNWQNKATWDGAPDGDKIVWQGAVGAGWRFDEALRSAGRRANTNYEATFKTNFNPKLDADVMDGDQGRTSSIRQSLGHLSTVATARKGKKTEITLIYPDEQTAYERLEDDQQQLKNQWPSSESLRHTPPVPW